MAPIKGNKVKQSVTNKGELVRELLEGVVVRYSVTHVDDRGTLTEMYDPRWGIDLDPLVYVYKVTVRPGKIKGWSQHFHQYDRCYFTSGTAKIVLYDNRPESKTYGKINEIYLGEEKPGLVIIPKNVFHAVQNVGSNEVVFINMPSQPYNHENPDRYRVDPASGEIPYEFKGGSGW